MDHGVRFYRDASGQRLPGRTYGVQVDIAVTTGCAGTPGLVQIAPAWVGAGGIAATLVIGGGVAGALVIGELAGPLPCGPRVPSGPTGALATAWAGVNAPRSRPAASRRATRTVRCSPRSAEARSRAGLRLRPSHA